MRRARRQRGEFTAAGHGRVLAAVVLAGVTGAAVGCARKVVPVTGDARVDALLSRMTLVEKISLTHGAQEDPTTFQGQAGYLPGVPRLGVPSLRFADGPPGVLTRIPAAAPTCTMGVAATFSREDARQNGILIAREAQSHGVDVVLQPFINMDRDLTFDRDFNTFGEDPMLTGQIGAAEIRGIQDHGIMAEAKHYVAYDTQSRYGAGDVTVDQQALHEIYVAPFADAVDAGVAALMCSYSKVNGEYSCGNADLLETILRDELGFKGFVTSDWGGTHATTFINAGLDMEMGGPLPMPPVPGRPQSYLVSYFAPAPVSPAATAKSNVPQERMVPFPTIPEEPIVMRKLTSEPPAATGLLSAVRSGAVSDATVARAAGRVLYEMDRFGYLDRRPQHSITPPNLDADAKIIEKTAEDAAVLLKNEAGALPLKENDLRSLALIGPGAGQTVAIGRPTERAVGLAERQIGAFEALKRDLAGKPGMRIVDAAADDMTGTTVPAEFLSHDGKPGLERAGGDGAPERIDAQLDFTHSNGRALPANSSYTWKGTLAIPSAGRYRLHLQLLGAFGTLSVDGKQVAKVGIQFLHGNVTQAGRDDLLPTSDGLDSIRVELSLAAGPHALLVSITPDTSNNPEQVRLNWLTPEKRKADYQAAIAAARQARTAVVFAWSRNIPHFRLPGDQDQLIQDVAAVNPNTIVVLNVSLPVAMPWLNKVKAVLLMWHPGDEGGWATANLLLGRASPAGRLPFTWPRRLEDTPVNDPAHPERQMAADGKTTYSEGILIGYRWFDARKIEPLFPFGYGLSYTRFEYSGLKVVPGQDGGLVVGFTVKNSGGRVSDEAPQVYLGAPEPQPNGVQFAVRALAAFDRIRLQPGESRAVTLAVPVRSLQYWSTASRRWVTAPGERTVDVGASSRDLLLHASVAIHP